MLHILRDKKTAKKVWIILAIIIIPAFTLWGFSSSGSGKEENKAAGRIFGKNISNLEFKKAFSAAQVAAILQFGSEFPKVEKYLDLESQAWERLILLEEAKRRKVRVSDQEVITTIQSMPFFQRKSGFDNKAYTEILRYVFRLQPRTFEEQMRQNLTLAKLYNQITGKIKLDDNQIRQEWLKNNKELSIYYIAGLFAEGAEQVKPNSQNISTNEESKKTVQNAITACANDLKENKPFNQTAKAHGLKAGQTKFFKSSDEIDGLGKASLFWEKANDLKEDQVSEVFSNSQGYYIIKLKAVEPVDEEKFAKDKEALGENMLSREKDRVFGEFVVETKKKSGK
jgi:parvulin-like peptidyl-prolyl isomerase